MNDPKPAAPGVELEPHHLATLQRMAAWCDEQAKKLGEAGDYDCCFYEGDAQALREIAAGLVARLPAPVLLDQPARVCGVTFGVGVESRRVVEAAQRNAIGRDPAAQTADPLLPAAAHLMESAPRMFSDGHRITILDLQRRLFIGYNRAARLHEAISKPNPFY